MGYCSNSFSSSFSIHVIIDNPNMGDIVSYLCLIVFIFSTIIYIDGCTLLSACSIMEGNYQVIIMITPNGMTYFTMFTLHVSVMPNGYHCVRGISANTKLISGPTMNIGPTHTSLLTWPRQNAHVH